MGNSATPSVPSALMKDYEHTTAQKLIRAIKLNSKKQAEEAIDCARKELMTFNTKLAHDKEYENMVKNMILYLTRGYNVGDGILFTKTPLEIAEEYHANEVKNLINETLATLNKSEYGAKILENRGAKVESKTSVGHVDKDRAALAKERLKAFQKEKK